MYNESINVISINHILTNHPTRFTIKFLPHTNNFKQLCVVLQYYVCGNNQITTESKKKTIICYKITRLLIKFHNNLAYSERYE